MIAIAYALAIFLRKTRSWRVEKSEEESTLHGDEQDFPVQPVVIPDLFRSKGERNRKVLPLSRLARFVATAMIQKPAPYDRPTFN